MCHRMTFGVKLVRLYHGGSNGVRKTKFMPAWWFSLLAICLKLRYVTNNLNNRIGIEFNIIWFQSTNLRIIHLILYIFVALILQLVSSGAFEISLNDIPIWSKLETGRIPSPQELFGIIENQIKVFADSLPSDFNE